METESRRFNLFLDDGLYWRLKRYVTRLAVDSHVHISMAEIIRMAIVAFLDKVGEK